MSDRLEARKERLRAYKAEYNAQPHLKEQRRLAARALSHARKLVTTRKRLETHTIAELIQIAEQKCLEQRIDFAANESAIRAVLAIYHGPENVHSGNNIDDMDHLSEQDDQL